MPKAAAESNIKPLIEHLLPAQSLKLLRAVAAIADEKGLRAYLVGGVVRDLFLVRENFDLDVTIEGNAQEVAGQVTQRLRGRLVSHDRFGTATVYADGGHVDLAIARTEKYARPGALPEVAPSTIEEDLRRRDFTINAIAASINAKDFGRILDPLAGRKDLDARRVHVIHDQSFTDDATRLLRAIRYTARYDFGIDPETARLMRQQASMLKTISGDRIRQEFVRILEEHAPEKALAAGHRFAILRELHPALVWDQWLEEAYRRARLEGDGTPAVYMALLCFRLDATDGEAIVRRIKLPAAMAKAVRQAQEIRLLSDALGKLEARPSDIFEALSGKGDEALAAARAAFGGSLVGKRLDDYIEHLKTIETALGGKELIAMGVAEGPDIGAVLHMLKRARLDSLVKDKTGEAAMVKAWLTHRVESEKQGKPNG
ncbi:MAG: CCA tRNA nucleotidyltransferase [Chloroflexi bacterium]|nr:CCA tRNA nucleotidyltransferase [Chloroflexota bacterium]